MILYNMMAGILRAFGDSRKPLYVLILCSLVNIAGDVLLVGVFHTGVGGAAAATVLAQIVSVAATWRVLIKSDFLEEKISIMRMKICKEHMGIMLKKGFPLALQSMLFPVANSIVQASVNTMGTNSIAAWGICDKLDLLIWLIADAMAPALTTYTAQNIGAGKHERVKKGALIGTGLSVISVGFISAVLYFGSGMIGPWFIDAKDVPALIPLVVKYMQMMAPFFIFYAVAEALSGACCGLGETLTPMITTLLTICLFRVVCIFAVLPKFGTMECIVWIYIASWILAGMAFTVLYIRKSRRISVIR
ncbi:MATE family efflux transporter [Blautia sp. HCP3S3_G3]|uniref:MATE family efflux transporter n=1 Tax=Blautia sp. HCP3S3_G3 TaxID=3438913 RepID=UPI003F8BA1B3